MAAAKATGAQPERIAPVMAAATSMAQLSRRRWSTPRWPDRLSGFSVVLGLAIAVMYLIWSPNSPDLAAQTAWAGLVHRSGAVPVFARWYEGVGVGSYSLLVPFLMGLLTVRFVAAVAGLAAVLLVAPLLRESTRPRLGLAVFGVCTAVNLLSGRVTFAVGVAVGAGAAVMITRSRPLGAGLLAVLTYAASPVAAVFLLVLAGALVLTDPARRIASLSACAGVLGAAGVSHWLFPLSGYEPFDRGQLVICLIIQIGIAVVPVGARVRAGALLGAALIIGTYFVHSPLGGNVARLSVLLMPAAAVADLAVRRLAAQGVAAVLLIYPVTQTVGDVMASYDPSANPNFATALEQRLSADPVARKQRIEVVDASTHWGAARLADAGFSVARGWFTQVDEVQNPEFYKQGLLTAASYRTFLNRTASAYVAVERSAPLDEGSVAEAALISEGLPYLIQVWADPNWTLYRVADPSPLAGGQGQVVRLTDTGLVVDTRAPGVVDLDINWSPFLRVTGGTLARHGSTVAADLSTPGEHVVWATWPWGSHSPPSPRATPSPH
jgi:hypothetical protein